MSSPDLRANVKVHLARNAVRNENIAKVLGRNGESTHHAPSTMAELATALGVARPALSRYLGGRPNPAGVTLVQVAAALGVPVDSLVWMGRR